MTRTGDTRRAMLRKALLGAGAGVAYAGGMLPDIAAAAGSGNAARGSRPDIVIFIDDDLSWTDIAPNDSKAARTPHRDTSDELREGDERVRPFRFWLSPDNKKKKKEKK